MRVLLDHCTPGKLKRFLVSHSVNTAQGKGWAALKNGELLQVAELEFDLFITCDRNIRYQQNLAGRQIAILELSIQLWSKMERLAPQIAEVVDQMKPAEYRVYP